MSLTDQICFIVAPIGEDGSDTRKRSNDVLRYVIRPVLSECGYQAVRADLISEPGLINSQVIQHIVEDPLVIIDLTDRNPNVFYELAIRHAVQKPFIQIIQKGQQLPFDVAGTRTIQLDHKDLENVELAKDELSRQIRTLGRSSKEIETPISVAIDLNFLKRSDDPRQTVLAELADNVASLQRFAYGVHDLLLSERQALLLGITQHMSVLFQETKRSAPKVDGGLSERDELSSITDAIIKIENGINEAIGEILADIECEFNQLANVIENEFTLKSDNTRQIVRGSFAADVRRFISETSRQEQLLDVLVTSFSDAMKTMGEYQRLNIIEATGDNASQLRSRILSSVRTVLLDVGKLRNELSLPSNVPFNRYTSDDN